MLFPPPYCPYSSHLSNHAFSYSLCVLGTCGFSTVSSLQESCSHALCVIELKNVLLLLSCLGEWFLKVFWIWLLVLLCTLRVMSFMSFMSSDWFLLQNMIIFHLSCFSSSEIQFENISASSCALDLEALQISLRAVWEDNSWDEALNLHGHKCPETQKSGLKLLVWRYKILCPLCFNISFKWQHFWRQSVSLCYSGKLNSVLSLDKEREEVLAASSLYELGICITA